MIYYTLQWSFGVSEHCRFKTRDICYMRQMLKQYIFTVFIFMINNMRSFESAICSYAHAQDSIINLL